MTERGCQPLLSHEQQRNTQTSDKRLTTLAYKSVPSSEIRKLASSKCPSVQQLGGFRRETGSVWNLLVPSPFNSPWWKGRNQLIGNHVTSSTTELRLHLLVTRPVTRKLGLCASRWVV